MFSVTKPGCDAESLITFVKDRAGRDRRYAIDASKIRRELGCWSRARHSSRGAHRSWYLDNAGWLAAVTSGEYRDDPLNYAAEVA